MSLARTEECLAAREGVAGVAEGGLGEQVKESRDWRWSRKIQSVDEILNTNMFARYPDEHPEEHPENVD